MARLHDSGGNLLGGLNADSGDLRLSDQTGNGHPGPTPEAAAVSATAAPAYVSPQPLVTHLNPMFGSEEIVPGLQCSYGSLAYSFADTHPHSQNVTQQSQRSGCHNRVAAPDERHHCKMCGGDYCTVHAEPAAHDCDRVVQPQR